MLYAKMLAEYQRLVRELHSLEEEIKKLPEGNIYCTKNETRYKWYHNDGTKKTYIPKKDRRLAEQLALKKYLTLQAEDISIKKAALELYLNNYPLESSSSLQLFKEHPAYQELLSPYFQPQSQQLCDWASGAYERNPFRPEHLLVKASSGNMVRSKSEALIDMVLHNHKIPFRYECALHLGAAIVYPDFTIRHPQTGKYFYWEHFGLMDDPGYRQNTGSKLQLYLSHNIIPSIQLITTYETKENPLSADTVEKIVKEYFL